MIPGGAGDGIGLERCEPALQGAGESDVFHQGVFRVTANLLVKRGGDQQGLVAVGEAKQAAAQVGPSRHKAGGEAGGVKAQAEISGFVGGGKVGARGL